MVCHRLEMIAKATAFVNSCLTALHKWHTMIENWKGCPLSHPLLRISEIILKTARIVEMRAWYCQVLEREPDLEHMPDIDVSARDGNARATEMRLCFFDLNIDFPYFQTLGIFEVPQTGLDPVVSSPGLHHMQMHVGTMEALIGRFETLEAKGIRPERSMNHGMLMSHYYIDPDGNKLEFTVSNFDTLEGYRGYIASEDFRRNPSGYVIDPDELRQLYRAGMPMEQLRRIGMGM